MQGVAGQDAVLTGSARASLQAQMVSVDAAVNSLQTERQDALQRVALLSDQLKLLDSKAAVIAHQEQSLSAQIGKMQPLVTGGKIATGKDATALTMIIQDNQVTQEQSQLYGLQMVTAVDLPKEREQLENQIQTVQRKAAGILKQITAQKARESALQDAQKAVVPTRIIRAASSSVDPVGPSRAVIVILGFLLGLLAGIFLALVLHAIRRNPADNAPSTEG